MTAPGANVLVVEDDAVAAHLRDAGESSVCRVGHYLDALGEMASRRFDAVVGPISALSGTLEQTAEALRTLGPQTRLLLVADAVEEPEAMRAVRLGFDDYLIRPLDAESLAGQVGRAAAPSPVAAPTPGDQPVIEALISGGAGLMPAALALIGARLGGADVVWTPGDTAPGGVPVVSGGQTAGALSAAGVSAETLVPHAAWLGRWMDLQARWSDDRRAASRDALTGLWNRRRFDESLGAAIATAKAARRCVSLMLWDVDNFKRYNESFGHPVGDRVLTETANLIRRVVRRQDMVARIGGDEFAVIFPQNEPRQADSQHEVTVQVIGQRVVETIASSSFAALGSAAAGTLTISAGLATYPWDAADAQGLIEAADQQLRHAKQSGKNRIAVGRQP